MLTHPRIDCTSIVASFYWPHSHGVTRHDPLLAQTTCWWSVIRLPIFFIIFMKMHLFVLYSPNRCESRRNFWTAEATMDPSFLVFLGPKINKFSCSLVGNFLKFVFKMSDRVWKSTFLEDWWLGHSRRKCLLSSRLWPQLQAGDVVLPMANLWAFRVDAWSLSFVWRVLPSLDP